ncbi:MAG: DUF547 domain-containing protein [Vicinamibacterales bacterium]
MRIRSVLAIVLAGAGGSFDARMPANDFDHTYAGYAHVLQYVHPPRVDYAALTAARATLDRVVAKLDSPPARAEPGWTREQRMAFWINAYNALTLRAIVDHYPIQSGWFTRQPRNSIRHIDGVWTDLTWRVAGRTVTLDDIEHRTVRPVFKDARIHFALNCASISCPPLAAEPYRPATLDAQMNEAARAYLASPEGLRVDGGTLRVSSIFKWYGEDFVAEYSRLGPGACDAHERAILGTVIRYGPPAAAELARSGQARIAFLDYDWSLNDVSR